MPFPVLVIGSGAREHALAWSFAREPGARVLCAPGNPGMASVAECHAVAPLDLDGLVALARRERVGLTVVGPEAPLASGLVDRFAREGLPAFGPTAVAAQLETSKAFAKAFMARHHVPTAGFVVCETATQAEAAIERFGTPVVLKADGLAAGKGVVIAETTEAAREAIHASMVAREFGEAGSRLVIEEYLRGEEASYFVLCDGSLGAFIGTAQDHKRVFDDDRGPNTGGMGAFSPSTLVDDAVRTRVEREIVGPVLAGMADEGAPFRGFLYVGLMLTATGPKVVEFNVRFGDPEAQVVLPSLAEPLAPRLADAAAGAASSAPLRRTSDRYVGVVLASGGYPGRFETGKPISGLERVAEFPGVLAFHAGTARADGRLVTHGGRVVTIVGSGPDYASAMTCAYDAASHVHFEGCHYRKDIGRKALTGWC